MFFFFFCDHIYARFWFLQEGKVEAEEFTEQLYQELKSTPQPCLVPFLKVISQVCAGKQISKYLSELFRDADVWGIKADN